MAYFVSEGRVYEGENVTVKAVTEELFLVCKEIGEEKVYNVFVRNSENVGQKLMFKSWISDLCVFGKEYIKGGNGNGPFVISPTGDINSFVGNFCLVKKIIRTKYHGKKIEIYNFIDLTGKIISPFWFEEVLKITVSNISVKLFGEEVMIDSRGEFLKSPLN